MIDIQLSLTHCDGVVSFVVAIDYRHNKYPCGRNSGPITVNFNGMQVTAYKQLVSDSLIQKSGLYLRILIFPEPYHAL